VKYLELETSVKQLTRVGFVVRDIGLLEGALSRPRASVFGEDAYQTLELKAAALMHSVVKNHALVDGNKRSSWFLLNNFVELNGFLIVSAQREAFDFILAVATDELNLEQMAEWISDRLTPLD
jgi:death-on-curing protein